MAPILARLRSGALANSLGVFFVKAAAGGASLIVFAIVARLCGPQEFGRFGVIFSAAMLAASFASAGQQALLVKEAPLLRMQSDAAGEAGLYRFSLTLTCAGAVLGALITAGWSLLGGATSLAAALAAASLCAMYAMSQTFIGFMRVFDRLLLGIAARDLGWRLLGLAGLGAMVLIGVRPDATSALLVLVASLLVAIVPLGVVMIRRLAAASRSAALGPVPRALRARWWSASGGLAIVALIAGADQGLFTVVLGKLHEPAGVGAFFASLKIVEVVNLFMVSVALAVTPSLSRAVARGDRESLQIECRTATATLSGPVLVACAALVLFAPWLLAFFNPAYASDASVLRILACATAVNALTGATGLLLQLGGMHWRLVAYQGASLVLALACLPLLVPRFGVEGAAFACLGSKLAWNLLAVRLIRSRLGVDPTCLSLLGART